MKDSVKEVASETAHAVKDATRDAMDDPDLKEALVAKVREVADQTKKAVADVAERHDLETSRLTSTSGANGSRSAGSPNATGDMGAGGSAI